MLWKVVLSIKGLLSSRTRATKMENGVDTPVQTTY